MLWYNPDAPIKIQAARQPPLLQVLFLPRFHALRCSGVSGMLRVRRILQAGLTQRDHRLFSVLLTQKINKSLAQRRGGSIALADYIKCPFKYFPPDRNLSEQSGFEFILYGPLGNK